MRVRCGGYVHNVSFTKISAQVQTHHWHCKLLRGIISLSLMLSGVEKPPALAKSQIFIILSDCIEQWQTKHPPGLSTGDIPKLSCQRNCSWLDPPEHRCTTGSDCLWTHWPDAENSKELKGKENWCTENLFLCFCCRDLCVFYETSIETASFLPPVLHAME